MSHDASATWSGFNYQGKVAIYHTLTNIVRKLNGDRGYNFSGSELVLESNEDFDIKGPNGFKSFHQVKAINQTAFSTYENALFAMLLQLDSPANSSVTGYLHTRKPLNWTGTEAFDQKLRGIIEKIIDNHIAGPENSYIRQTFTSGTVTEKKIKILRQAKEKDERLVDEESIIEVLNQARDSLSEGHLITRVKQYDYDFYGEESVLACDINSIDQRVKRVISELHNIHNIDSNDDALDRVFCALLAKLDENIISKHLNLNSGVETPIPFEEIIDIVVDDSTRDSDHSYMASKFKLEIISAFEEFLDDDDLCSPEVAEAYANKDDNSNLNSAMAVLLDLPASELFHYYKKLSPHITLDSNDTMTNGIRSDPQSLKYYLFPVFSEMCLTKFIHNKDDKLFLYASARKRYLPTTIGHQTRQDLVKKIMNNGHAITFLFESDAMVTGCTHANEIDCFADEYCKLTDVNLNNAYDGEAPNSREKVPEISRNIRLIKVSTAIEEINNA